MSKLSQEEIEQMFADFGLAREEDRTTYRELARLGDEDASQEQFTKIDSNTDPLGEGGARDAKLA